MDVVDETPAAVDLDDRDPLPVRRLEPGIAVDRDLAQFEADLVPSCCDHAPGGRAEVAAGCGVEDDFGYG
jgi:hypothetical protein